MTVRFLPVIVSFPGPEAEQMLTGGDAGLGVYREVPQKVEEARR